MTAIPDPEFATLMTRLGVTLDDLAPTPLFDALLELPNASPCRAHYLRERIAALSGEGL